MRLIGEKPMTAAERQRRYYQKNREKALAADAAFRAANPERYREIARQSASKHSAARANRMAQRRAASSEYLILPSELKRLYAAPCASCGSSDRPSLDHIIPLTRGGRHSIGNLQTLCFSCNASKNNRTMMEWRMGKVARRKAA